jgi:hypothetical protein
MYSARELLNFGFAEAAKVDANLGGTEDFWSDQLRSVDGTIRRLVLPCMVAGQQFMNFTAALLSLVLVAETATTIDRWNTMLSILMQAVTYDVDVDFARPATLAVIRLV